MGRPEQPGSGYAGSREERAGALVSRKGEALAADYTAAILASTGVVKGAGMLLPAPVVLAIVRPLAEALVQKDKQVATLARQARQTNKALREHQRLIDAIAAPATASPSPMRLPQQRMVDFRPAEWRTTTR
jgi:hypothetical protein